MERQTVTKILKPATRNHSVQRQSAAPYRSGCRFTELQRSVGNQAVQRLINSHYIQAKLQVSSPDDQYEQEADRLANRVMRMPDPNLAGGVTVSKRMQISRVQRKCAACEAKMQVVQRVCTECSAEDEKEKELVQGKADDSSGSQVSHGVQSQIEGLRGGGQPLPASARTYFEPRFGYDFSGVRIHAGSQAAQVARSINAKAFTVGKDIAFGSGEYSPQTNSGKSLLAHELVHVVQQGSAATSIASRAPIHLARQPNNPPTSGGPAAPTQTNLIRVSCVSNTIEFETDTGVFIYELTECDIEDADYIADVTVTGNDVHFSGPPNAPGAGASWAYRISPGQPDPSQFFPNQNTVHIVTGTLSPTPGPVPGPTPGPSPGPRSPFQVCARDLQISPAGQHGYIEAPPFRYAIISPLCPQHWYDNPVWPGSGGQKWDNSPDPCGKDPTCVECLPKQGVTDLAVCFRNAFNAYNNPSLYRLSGPNSNTFAGTLARACCANMVPKPAAFGWMPGWDDPPAPPRTGSEPCPPGPSCKG